MHAMVWAAVVLLLVGVALGPTVLSAAADINTTSMADVVMGDVIVLSYHCLVLSTNQSCEEEVKVIRPH